MKASIWPNGSVILVITGALLALKADFVRSFSIYLDIMWC